MSTCQSVTLTGAPPISNSPSDQTRRQDFGGATSLPPLRNEPISSRLTSDKYRLRHEMLSLAHIDNMNNVEFGRKPFNSDWIQLMHS
jgi:hypothetical protein